MGVIKKIKDRMETNKEIKDKITLFVKKGAEITLSIKSEGMTQDGDSKINALMAEISKWIEEICKTPENLSAANAGKKEKLITEILHLMEEAIDREIKFQTKHAEYSELLKNAKEENIDPSRLYAERSRVDDEEQWAIIGRMEVKKKVAEAEDFCRRLNRKNSKRSTSIEQNPGEQARG